MGQRFRQCSDMSSHVPAVGRLHAAAMELGRI